MGFSFHGRKRKQMALPSPLSDFWVALARRIDQSKTIQRNGIQFQTSGAKICLRNRPTQLPSAQLWPRLQPHLILHTWLSNFFLLALRSEILPQKTIGCDPKKYILGIPNGTRVWGNLHPHENEASQRNMKHSETPTLRKMKMKTPPMETWDAQKLTLRKRKCNIIYGWRHKTFHLNLTSRTMKLTRYQVEKWNTQKLPPSGKWKWYIIRWKNETLRNSYPQENEKKETYTQGETWNTQKLSPSENRKEKILCWKHETVRKNLTLRKGKYQFYWQFDSSKTISLWKNMFLGVNPCVLSLQKGSSPISPGYTYG